MDAPYGRAGTILRSMIRLRATIARGTYRSRPRPFLAAATTVLAVTVLLLGAVGATANPSIRGKRAQAKAVLAQVQQLDLEVSAAAERWNGANYRLDQVEQNLTATTRELGRAQAGVQHAQKVAGARLRQLYVDGPPAGPMEVILGATSVQDVLDLLDVQRRVTAADTRIIRDLASYRSQVVERQAELRTARSEQLLVVRRRAGEKAAIEAKLAERKQLLVSVQAEVQQLVVQERARQAELKRQAEIRLEQERQAAAKAARISAQQRADQEAAAVAATPAATTESTTQATATTTPSPDGPAAEPATSEPGTTTDPVTAPEPPAPPPADASRAAEVVAVAMRYLGTPYVWGGATPAGFDCSGLVTYAFAQIGVSVPHYAAAQFSMGEAVPKDDLQVGDLVFFRDLGHVGIYIGGGQFIHAPHTGDVVKISSLSEPYYVRNWVGARRLL